MLNPIQVQIAGTDGGRQFIIIEPVLEKSGDKVIPTGTFKIYKDAFGQESVLFTEPLELDEPGAKLSDDLNPDYLGMFCFEHDGSWTYKGDLLTQDAQAQVAAAIQKG